MAKDKGGDFRNMKNPTRSGENEKKGRIVSYISRIRKKKSENNQYKSELIIADIINNIQDEFVQILLVS